MATGVVPATEPPMIKLEYRSFFRKVSELLHICIRMCVPYLVLRGVYIYIYISSLHLAVVAFIGVLVPFCNTFGLSNVGLMSFQQSGSLSCNYPRY